MTPVGSGRLASIDATRGLLVFGWLLSEIGVPALYHVDSNAVTHVIIAELSPSFWEGSTIRDLVLPAFCFLAGVSIVPAFERRKERGQSNRDVTIRIGRRVLLLVGIGLICEGGLFEHWPSLRLVGAFQRIAICYAVAAFLELSTGRRMQAGLAAFLLLNYWAILAYGTVSDSSDPFSPEGNVVAAVDRLILPGRKYFATWDPDGFMTTIPAIAVTIIGLLAGSLLTDKQRSCGNASLWLIGLGIAALNLAFLWDMGLPINSYLWTSSFCLLVMGVQLMLLGSLHAVIEARGIAACAAPFSALGRNSLVIVLGVLLLRRSTEVLTAHLSLFRRLFPDGPSDPVCATLIAIAVIATACLLDRQRTYLTV
jgi:predicted acyltransferase